MKDFSMVRVSNLVSTWWYENKNGLFRSLGAIILLQVLVIWYWISLNFYAPPYMLWYLLTSVFLFVQVQRISNAFKSLHSPLTGSQWLLLPATPQEKFISIFFWNSFVFTLSGIIISIIMEKIGMIVLEQLYISNPVKYEFRGLAANEWFFSKAYFTTDNRIMKFLWLFWLAAQFLFYWAAIRVKKGSFLLPGLILFAGFYLFGLYVRNIKPIFFSKEIGWNSAWEIDTNSLKGMESRNYNFGEPLTTFFHLTLIAIGIYLLYKACTHLIREKTVSQ